MSLRDWHNCNGGVSRRRVLALLGSSMAAGSLVSACKPLYGPTASGAALKDVMAGIEINTIPGRVGQRVRNELIFDTTRGGYAAEAQYQLNISVREAVQNILVESTGDARGQLYILDAKFKLVHLADKRIVLEGKSTARAAFDRFDPIFANVRARIDAENRAADTIAEGIRTRIAAHLSSSA